METPALRIGAVARRTGVAVATLRAWEARYGVLRPTRTEGGHRLYSEEDVDRVLAVLRLTGQGWSVGAAAASVTTGRTAARLGLVSGPAGTSDPGDPADEAARSTEPSTARARDELARAVRSYDGSSAEDVLDASIARLGVAHALEDVVLPVLRDLGVGWEEDPSLISVEHFATNVLRPRLMRLVTATRSGAAPRCVAAAPEGEDHELGVLAAAAVAADLGFRVTYLGARTPTAALERSVATIRPDVVLIGAVTARAGQAFASSTPDVGDARLVVGGPGFAGLHELLPQGTGRSERLSELRGVLDRALREGGATG